VNETTLDHPQINIITSHIITKKNITKCNYFQNSQQAVITSITVCSYDVTRSGLGVVMRGQTILGGEEI
jgi:hypothetical protein